MRQNDEMKAVKIWKQQKSDLQKFPEEYRIFFIFQISFVFVYIHVCRDSILMRKVLFHAKLCKTLELQSKSDSLSVLHHSPWS